MGFSKCEKSFVGIFIFSSMFKIRYFYFDKKKRMIPTITYKVLFNFSQLI